VALGPDDLVLCAATLAKVPLLERMEVAAAAGYTGLSLFLDDLEDVGVDDAELRARLDGLGLAIGDLDPHLTWVPGVAQGGAGFERWGTDDFLRAAERVGARSINAACFKPGVTHDQLVEPFRALCDAAAEADLYVHVEFMPFSAISDLDRAVALVDAAERDNAGIMFDVWHFVRSGSRRETLAREAHRVWAIQLDDCPAEAEPNPIEETLHRRLMPGEGDADVAGLIRILDAGGCRAPLGVEIFSEELAALSPAAAAKRAIDATRQVVAEARAR
jgi:sugar phosphate isomerase/epimerase